MADTRASAVDAALQALVPAVGQAEAAGTTVEIVVAGPATYSGPATIIKTYTDRDQVELGG